MFLLPDLVALRELLASPAPSARLLVRDLVFNLLEG